MEVGECFLQSEWREVSAIYRVGHQAELHGVAGLSLSSSGEPPTCPGADPLMSQCLLNRHSMPK